VTAFAGWARASADPAEARTRDTLAPVLARSCQVFFYLVAVLLVLQNLGYNVAGLLAGLGIGGLAVALAAKETLANLFGSLALLMDRTFQVGDTIKQGDVEGEVVNIGLRSTRVRTKEGYVVSIPNQLITNAAVTNMTPTK
jgi:MscS family membrane protein